MFGNRLGWGISGVLVLVTALALFLMGREVQHIKEKQQREQKPENVAAKYMTIIGKTPGEWRIALATQPGDIAREWMTQDGDPAALYREAIGLYNQSTIAASVFKTGADRIGKLTATERELINQAMEKLIAASKLKGKDVLKDEALKLIGYEVASDTVASDQSSLRALQALGDCANRMAWFYKQQQDLPDREQKAIDLYQAQFSLGMKLFDERITVRELILGKNLMSIVFHMAKHAKTEEERKRLERLDGDLTALGTSTLPTIWGAMWTNDPNVYDMAALAMSSPELVWRVEAILTLGRARFRADPAKTKDMYEQSKAHAGKVIEALTADADPLIREAAGKASKLTEPEWLRMSAFFDGGRQPYILPEY